MKCSDCKKEFRRNIRGCKIIPKPLCPECVVMNKNWVCSNPQCREVANLKQGYKDECWACKNPLCFKCASKKVKVEGIEFSFCEEHPNPDMEELKQNALDLIEEEKSLEISQKG